MTDEEISRMTIGDVEKLTERLKVAVQTLQEARALIGAPAAPQGLNAAPPTQHVPQNYAQEAAPRPEVTFIGEDPKTARPVIPIAPRPGVSAFAPMPPKLAPLTDLPKDLQHEMGMED